MTRLPFYNPPARCKTIADLKRAQRERLAPLVSLVGGELPSDLLNRKPPMKRRPITAVRAVETGQVFTSAQSAARAIGVSAKAVKRAVTTGCRAGGMHWTRSEREGEA